VTADGHPSDVVALITGAASGIGLATARTLAGAGVRVVLADVDADGGARAAAELGGEFIAADVSDLAANEAMVAFATERCGGLDYAYLNAGVTSGCSLGEDFDLAKYRRAMGVNLDGVAFGVHAVLPALRARGGGAIVATASLAGLTGVRLDPIYAANKHAVVGLTRSLGMTLADEGIRFNAICPGFTVSAMTAPIADAIEQFGVPLIETQKVADAVTHLLLEAEVSGECWYVQYGRPAEAFGFRGVPGPRDAASA
jgi:NAD(P)-dependent dehydrogenase (short-subunit alcohol dehydrogenase family)